MRRVPKRHRDDPRSAKDILLETAWTEYMGDCPDYYSDLGFGASGLGRGVDLYYIKCICKPFK